MIKKSIIVVLLLFLIGGNYTLQPIKDFSGLKYKENYMFSDRGCVIVRGSDSIIGVRFILLEGYCVELEREGEK